MRKLDDLGTLTFGGTPAGDGVEGLRWVGLGLGRDDDWELVVVWAFADADAAAGSVDSVVAAVEEGEVPSMIEGDVGDRLERDEALVSLRAPLRVEPAEWRRPLTTLDPLFGQVVDLGDDEDEGDDGGG